MNSQDFFSKLLHAFDRYYSINQETPEDPFAAEAEFRSHTEKYVLVKSAKIAEIDSNEFVYFALEENLTISLLNLLANKAWEKGLKKVHPYSGHRNSDIALIIVSENLPPNMKKIAKKIKFSKNYRFGFYGYSNFKLAIYECNSGNSYSNYFGKDFIKIFNKIGL